MKVLIVGPLGAGKSSLAYAINRQLGLPRLNLDEIHRNPAAGGAYYPQSEQFARLDTFIAQYADWVAEGCQKHLYERLNPDIVVDMRINRWIVLWRFTLRFFKAKKLIGRDIASDMPVQAYHYRKPTLCKIREYDLIGQEINADIASYLKNNPIKVIKCSGYKDYPYIFRELKAFSAYNQVLNTPKPMIKANNIASNG